MCELDGIRQEIGKHLFYSQFIPPNKLRHITINQSDQFEPLLLSLRTENRRDVFKTETNIEDRLVQPYCARFSLGKAENTVDQMYQELGSPGHHFNIFFRLRC